MVERKPNSFASSDAATSRPDGDQSAVAPEQREQGQRGAMLAAAGDSGPQPAPTPGLGEIGHVAQVAQQVAVEVKAPADDDNIGSIPGPGALIDNKYRVERLIARGGMGAVYAATHTVSGKKVALKWMLPALGQIHGARERFMQEACATARIAHPNIVDIYDVGSESSSVYLVMEYLRGETLADRMCRERMSVTDCVALLMPALRGVAAAHSHGVIHRDLKPENIFLCRTEHGEELEPKVLDFGISKITTDEVQSMALTHSGAVLGTPYYMSPEQVRGARNVDVRADVYAFGVILFEALTGERPFEAETYNELILKIATEPPPRVADLNPNLDPRLIAIVERAMQRDPNSRFGDIKQLALALEPFAGGVRFRSMQTLNSYVPPASGDFPVGTIAPTRADTAPARLAEAESIAPVPGRDSQDNQVNQVSQDNQDSQDTKPRPAGSQRGARIAVAAAFAALVACAAIALHFLRNPDASAVAGTADRSAATAAPLPAAPAATHPPAAEPALGQANVQEAKTLPSATENAPPAAPEHGFAAPSSPPAPASPPARSATRAKNSAAEIASANAASKRAAVSGGLAKRSSRSSVAPAPAAAPEPAHPVESPLVVRPLPEDWDQRIDEIEKAPPSVHMPAGSIDMRDFR